MAFFTRFCKKLSLCVAFVLLAPSLAFAANYIHIKSADLEAVGETYHLNADAEIKFDDDLENAINKGVPLSFVVEFQIVSPRKYWFDDEVVTKTQHVGLSYHALSRQYLLMRDGRQQAFDTLLEAKLELGEVRDWKVLDKNLIEKGEVYYGALLIRLDQTKLPKALQVESIGSKDWQMQSQKYIWALKELAQKEPREPAK